MASEEWEYDVQVLLTNFIFETWESLDTFHIKFMERAAFKCIFMLHLTK